MKYLRKINEMLDRKFLNGFNFCKEELDKLSTSEISEVRFDLIKNSRPDYKRKCSELEIYINDRNPEIQIDMYNEWLRKSKITKRVLKSDGFYQDFYHDEVKNNYFTDSEMETFKLLIDVVESFGGPESYFRNLRDKEVKRLGDSQYGLY